MFCRNCGKELADDAKFCACCGTQVMNWESEKALRDAVVMPVQEKKNNGKLWVVGAVAVVVLLGVVFVGKGIVKLSQESKEESGTKIENLVGREPGLYKSDGSFVPWDDLGIDVETDYTDDNYAKEAKCPYNVFYDQSLNYRGELVFPDNITKIGENACRNTPFTKIDLSNTQITSIGEDAFCSCSFSLKCVDFPNTLTHIGAEAFIECLALESIDLSNTQIASIGERAFACCWSVESIDLSNTQITSIGKEAFRYCHSFESIDLSNTQIASIGESAFRDCTALESIDLSNTQIASIEESAFQNCTALESIDLSNTQIASIGKTAFFNCESLESVDFPDTITSIGEEAFKKCNSLTNINYAGTMEEWNAIEIYSSWRSDSAIETITCSDGVITL